MTSSAAWLLSWGIVAVLVIFVLASGAKRSVALGALLILIPFQTVDTRYASSSVLMAYALATMLLISGELRFRMLPALIVVVLAYLLSFTQADRGLLVMNVITIFQFVSCLIIFLLAYNFAGLVKTEKTAVDILFATNSLVVVYCILQLIVGPGESFVPFGVEEFAFNSNRNPDDPRLVGPFGNPGTTAGYFTLMILVCAMDLMFSSGGKRLFVLILAGFNLLGLVATGNRTGFLILVAMFPVMLFTFRRELGAKRVTQFVIGGTLVLAIASTVAVAYTDFGRMFNRLATVTQTEGGVPTTRAETWPVAIEKIKERPWLGEGPYFWTEEDAEEAGQLRTEFEELGELDTIFDPYPHSLYLYLLRTVGIVGLLAVLWFFFQAWRHLSRASRLQSARSYGLAFVRLGTILIPAFLIAQITLEFNRRTTLDYAQFVFALIGLLLGVADRERHDATAEVDYKSRTSARSVEYGSGVP